MKKSLLLIPSLVATASMPLVGLVGCTKSEPVAKDFATDSWSTVCFYANQGIDKLHEVYSKDCEKNDFMPGTLIGLERTATLNGEEHKVMVIDEKADTYNDKLGVVTPAALTFQFRNLISGGDQEYKGKKMALFINWTDKREEGAGNYWNSTLDNALNGTDTEVNPVKWQNENESFADIHISVYEMINNENPDLANNIKHVKRTVCTFTEKDNDGNPKWKLSYGSTRLFCPTISNYFSPMGLAATDDGIIGKHRDLCLKEGQTDAPGKQYKYYAQSNRIGDSVIGKNVGDIGHEEKPKFDFMVITDVANSGPKPVAETYWSWVGSPWLEDKIDTEPDPGEGGDRVANISPWGSFCNHADINDFNAVAPCFCI